MKRAVVLSTGASLPARIATNRDLESLVETSDEWIIERTGIKQRHLAADDEFTSHLAANAAKDALARAGVSAESVDLLIVATATPDDTIPSTAAKVQHMIGMTKGAAFDIAAACSGFVYGLSIAQAYAASGQAKRVLVIGAETFSRILDWKDRTTCILFGDGAACVLLDVVDSGERGLLISKIYSDGQYAPLLGTHGGVSSTKTAGTLFMAGKDIYRHAVAKMPEAVTETMSALGQPISAIDWLVPHQANQRILQAVAQKLAMQEDKVISTVAQHANTSAASIPLALHVGVMDGRIKPGQLVVCPAMGAGLTWGCSAIRW